jgi:hypothetical protein
MAQDNFDLRKFLTENKLTQDPTLNVFTEGNYGTTEELEEGEGHDQEIISYIADTYIQNAKHGDRAYDGFRDLHISDAVQDVIGILQDPNHPLHAATKEEYAIVEKDKARGIFEEGNYDTNA